jgi:predicted amidohydrolase YtcJ
LNKGFKLWLAALWLLSWPGGCRPVIPVDLVVHHARVYTANQDSTVVEAFAVHQGRFVEVGSSAFICAKYKGAIEIAAAGNWVYPGFTDAQGKRQEKGSIVRQQEASFVILEEAPQAVPGKKDPQLQVARAFRQGQEVYRRSKK